MDPLSKEFPWNSTYAYAENDVIRSVDLDGLEKFFAIDGSFIGSIGVSNEVRVLNSDNDVEAFVSNQEASAMNVEFNSILLTSTNEDIQSRVITTIYEKEIAKRNVAEGVEYPLFGNKVFIRGNGLEEFVSDNGGVVPFNSGDNANSYYSLENEHGVINVNNVENDYYNIANRLEHEDNHNQQTKSGINTKDPKNHFDVIWDAYQTYKKEISQDRFGTGHVKEKLQTELQGMESKLNQIYKNNGSDSKQYRKTYNQYTKRKDKFEREFK